MIWALLLIGQLKSRYCVENFQKRKYCEVIKSQLLYHLIPQKKKGIMHLSILTKKKKKKIKQMKHRVIPQSLMTLKRDTNY